MAPDAERVLLAVCRPAAGSEARPAQHAADRRSGPRLSGLWQAAGHSLWPFRQIHRLLGLSELQAYRAAARTHGHFLPRVRREARRRAGDPAFASRQDILRLLALSGL